MDELTSGQRDALRQRLEALRAELTQLLASSLDGSQPVALDQPIGRLSRMDALQQQSMTQASRRAAQQRLERVDRALTRLAGNDYGCCRACEEAIGFARLQAQPEALFCLNCQRNREQHRQEG